MAESVRHPVTIEVLDYDELRAAFNSGAESLERVIDIRRRAVARQVSADIAKLGITLPLIVDGLEIGHVVDATGRVICVVDVRRELSDRAAVEIAQLIVAAVNAYAGVNEHEAEGTDAR